MNRTEIQDIYSEIFEGKIIYPDSQESIAMIKTKIQDLKKDNTLTGLKSGYFDGGIHPNHEWELRHIRMELVKRKLELEGGSFKELTNEEKKFALVNTKVALILLIPGNEHTNLKKSKKGYFKRPIQDWTRRAQEVAGVSLPLSNGNLFPVVNFITAYDSIDFKDTEFESYLSVGQIIKPNLWFVSGENPNNDFNALKEYCDEVVKLQPINYETNPITGNPYNTTDKYRHIIKNYLEYVSPNRF